MGIHTNPKNCANRRAVKPLRQKAVKAADKAQPTCTNTEERNRWLDAYIKAAGNGSWECGCPKEKEPASPVGPCLNNKSIEVILKRKKRQTIHEWWPTDVEAAYKNEEYQLKHTAGNEGGNLGATGNVEVNNIPSGVCVIEFPQFYAEIEAWIKEQLHQ